MVGLETLQLGKSWDEEPWKVGTNNTVNGLWERCNVLHLKSLIQRQHGKIKNCFRLPENEQRGVVFTVHGVLAVGEELRQRPEGIFLIQVH